MPIADSRVALPTGERQYHIDLGPGELAEYILLPGDPDRTARIATRLESIEFERRNREFASVTGMYKGLRVSIVSTGIGADNVEIVIAEILAITEQPTIIRVGSSGGLQPETLSGDLCITADIPLAARIIEAGGTVIRFRGEPLTEANVRQRLNMRDFLDDLRGGGVVTGGPPPYGPKDKQRFANTLDRWISKNRWIWTVSTRPGRCSRRSIPSWAARCTARGCDPAGNPTRPSPPSSSGAGRTRPPRTASPDPRSAPS